MKRILCIIFSLFMLASPSFADEVMLNAGISLNDIPKEFFGCWRINAKLEETDSYKTFKPQSLDMWNLSRVGDIVRLQNPISGADAEVSVKSIDGNLISFSKKIPYDNKVLTDTVTIRLDKNSFTGINTLTLELFSLVDGHLLKSEHARYIINGSKIAGDNILQ